MLHLLLVHLLAFSAGPSHPGHYHVGQIGILRTEMGYTSLRQRLYDTRQTG